MGGGRVKGGVKSILNKKTAEIQRFKNKAVWSWRESNPRPNEEIISFLHAYLCLDFRAPAEPKPSTDTLSSKFSSAVRGRSRLSPISLHHFTGMLRSNSFRVMSRPSTWCRD